MKEGFEFVTSIRSHYGGVRKKKEVINPNGSKNTILSFLLSDCLVFIKDTTICAGKFKQNKINYIFPFFPEYIEYMLQVAPYFFIHEEYLEKLEKYQPIYDITSAFDFLQEKKMVKIDTVKKIITFSPLGPFEDENGMLILPEDKVKRIKTNYPFSSAAKKSNQRQYEVAVNEKLTKNYGMERLANTLGYSSKGELKQAYVPPPKPLTYNGKEYDFRTE